MPLLANAFACPPRRIRTSPPTNFFQCCISRTHAHHACFVCHVPYRSLPSPCHSRPLLFFIFLSGYNPRSSSPLYFKSSHCHPRRSSCIASQCHFALSHVVPALLWFSLSFETTPPSYIFHRRFVAIYRLALGSSLSLVFSFASHLLPLLFLNLPSYLLPSPPRTQKAIDPRALCRLDPHGHTIPGPQLYSTSLPNQEYF